jgi:hypothetical protein
MTEAIINLQALLVKSYLLNALDEHKSLSHWIPRRAGLASGRNTSSNQRPDTLTQDGIARINEISCTARPDHTLGQRLSLRRAIAASCQAQ